MFEFLYGDKTITEVINIFIKFYRFSFDTIDSHLGLLIFIVLIFIIANMLLSISLLFIQKTKQRYKYLSIPEWILHIIGNIIMMCSIITLYFNLTNLLCHLRTIFVFVGFIISLTPVLSKLIISNPKINKISEWTEVHRIIFNICVIFIGIILNGILMLSTYDIESVENPENKDFLICLMNEVFGNFLFTISLFYDVVIIVIMFILLLMEWNLKASHTYIRLILLALCLDIIFLSFNFISMKISYNNYITYNLLFSLYIFCFSLTNYVIIYISNIFIKQDEDILNMYNKKIQQFSDYSVSKSNNNYSYDTSNVTNMFSENTNGTSF